MPPKLQRAVHRLLCAFCVLSSSFLSAQALDRNAITIVRYDLNLRIEPRQQRLAVRGKLRLRNDSTLPQKTLALQVSSSLHWRSIQANGKPLEFLDQPYTSDIDHTGGLSEAIITLPQELPAKANLDLEIGYEGVLPLDATRLTRIGVPQDTALHTDWDQINKSFATVRGVGDVAWYPISTDAANLSEANSVQAAVYSWQQRSMQSEMHLQICVWGQDETLTTLTNSPSSAPPAKASTENEGNCSAFDIAPLARALPFFMIGAYENRKHPALDIWYLPGHKAIADNYAKAADTVLPFITNWFGAPHQPARVLELQDAYASPYENGPELLTPLHEIESNLAEIVAVHQLTHAAFPSPRNWIYEGLAHFTQAVYREQQANRTTALNFMKDYLPAILDAEKSLAPDKDAPTSQSLINTSMEELYRSKSMYVWWMLRDMLGDRALKDALAAYHPQDDKEPSYLQHLLESKSGHDLEWFFDDWVYRDRGLPDFRVESVYPRQTMQGSYMLTITVENIGAAGAEVPITIHSNGGEVTKRIEVLSKAKNTIRIVVPIFPTDVVLNDGSVPETDISNNTFLVPTNPPAP